VNFELRPFALNAIDLNAFKLLHCVDENDFFAMDKILFKDQKKWIVTNQSDKVLENSTNALKNYGALFGVSEEAFNSCMENENITDFILEQRIEGVEEYDISSTPTFIINGEIYAGNMSINEFDEIIEKEIN
jgi:protein-disulfide isomerase